MMRAEASLRRQPVEKYFSRVCRVVPVVGVEIAAPDALEQGFHRHCRDGYFGLLPAFVAWP
jgi:hypothetical protein